VSEAHGALTGGSIFNESFRVELLKDEFSFKCSLCN